MKIHKDTVKHIKSIFILSLLAGLVFTVVYSFRLSMLNRSEAAPRPQIATFRVSPNPLTVGQDFDLYINVDPQGLPWNVGDFIFTFDSSKVELRDAANPKNNVQNVYPGGGFLPPTSEFNGNRIRILNSKKNAGVENVADIIKITMKVKSGVPSGVTSYAVFTWVSAIFDGSPTNTLPAHGSFNIIAETEPKTGTVSFSSAKSTYNAGENLDLKLNINPGGGQVKTMKAFFNYDDTIFDFQDMTGDLSLNIVPELESGFDQSNYFFTVEKDLKLIKIEQITGTNPLITGNDNITVATIKLKIRQDVRSGTSTSFQVNDNSILGSPENNNIIKAREVYSLNINSAVIIISMPSPTPTKVPVATCINRNYNVCGNTECAWYANDCGGICYPFGTLRENIICPTLTPTPSPTATIAPTPPSDRDKYLIDIGSKQTLVIAIGSNGPIPPPDTPYVKFAVRFYGLEGSRDGAGNTIYPDLKVRLNAADMVAKLIPPEGVSFGDGCITAGYGDNFYKEITLSSDANKIYSPKPGSSFIHNGQTYNVTDDGWVPLVGRNIDTVYSLSVKGPKHRNTVMAKSQILSAGKTDSQDFDWTETAIEPGDLVDPNNLADPYLSGNQDCVVNMTDLSLITNRLGCVKSPENKAVWNCPGTNENLSDPDLANVDENDIINAQDFTLVIHTLESKPDDD